MESSCKERLIELAKAKPPTVGPQSKKDSEKVEDSNGAQSGSGELIACELRLIFVFCYPFLKMHSVSFSRY